MTSFMKKNVFNQWANNAMVLNYEAIILASFSTLSNN